MRSHQAGTFVQPSLFAPREGGSNRTKTIRAAAESSARLAPTCRQRVLAELRTLGGMTHEELSVATGIRLDTVKARVHELGAMGLVRALKNTRATSTGHQALVFVAAENVNGREVEPWPIPRVDWRTRAINAERRAHELQVELDSLRGLSGA